MPPISFKKIALVLLAVIALSRLDKISATLSAIYEFFCDSLAPFHNSPAEGRFVVALAILALVYVTLFKLLHDRGRK